MLERLTVLPPGFFAEDGKRLSLQAYVFLVLLCLAFFTPGLASLPPTDRDESLFAQASKQMIESGNYVDIRFQDQPRYKKPIGIYWLQAASAWLLDPHHRNEIWAYRVPSFLGATLAVLMTAALGALLFGGRAGLLGAIMMAGCLILNVEARLAKTDAALLGSIMVAQYALAQAYIGAKTAPIGGGTRLAFWTTLAAGVLLKGPVILLVIFSTLLWLRVTEKHLRWFAALKPLIGIPYALALIAPWFIAIMLASHGQFVQQAAGHDLLDKLWQDQGRGFLPPGSYLLAFPLSFFPFALWALLAAPDSWISRRQPAVRFCLGWIIPVWIAFELVLAKLPHYVMPVYPAIALLTAKALLDGFPGLKEWRWLPPLATGLWLMAGTCVALAAVLLPFMLDHKWNAGQIAAGLLVVMALGASLLIFFRRRESGIVVTAAASLVFMMNLFGTTLPHTQNLWVSSQVARTALLLKPCPGDLALVSTYNAPSLVFLAGTRTLLRNDGKAVGDLMRQDPCRVAAVEDKQRDNFLRSFAQNGAQPQSLASIHGLDVSRGRMVDVSLFILPQGKPAP